MFDPAACAQVNKDTNVLLGQMFIVLTMTVFHDLYCLIFAQVIIDRPKMLYSFVFV